MKPTKKTAKASKKKILIIDDHPMMREGLAQLIANEPDLHLCGESGEAHDGLEKINALQPDLVLSDISLPGKNGVELIKDIQAMQPGLAVLVISSGERRRPAARRVTRRTRVAAGRSLRARRA